MNIHTNPTQFLEHILQRPEAPQHGFDPTQHPGQHPACQCSDPNYEPSSRRSSSLSRMLGYGAAGALGLAGVGALAGGIADFGAIGMGMGMGLPGLGMLGLGLGGGLLTAAVPLYCAYRGVKLMDRGCNSAFDPYCQQHGGSPGRSSGIGGLMRSFLHPFRSQPPQRSFAHRLMPPPRPEEGQGGPFFTPDGNRWDVSHDSARLTCSIDGNPWEVEHFYDSGVQRMRSAWQPADENGLERRAVLHDDFNTDEQSWSQDFREPRM